MTRVLFASLAATLLWSAPSLAATKKPQQPGKHDKVTAEAADAVIDMILKPVQAAKAARDIIEALATTHKPATTQIKYYSWKLDSRLQLVSYKSEIVVETTDENPLGNNLVRFSVPYEVRYYIDLSRLNHSASYLNERNKTLTVYMIDVVFDDPMPDWESAQVLEERNPWPRSASSFVNVVSAAKDTKLKPLAKEGAERWQGWATREARPQLEKHLQSIIHMAGQDITVIVK